MTGTGEGSAAERPIGVVRGTRDWLPADYARLASLERQLIDGFVQAGYTPMRTPILEFTELHERKSGAGIVAKLIELPEHGQAGTCLRPELTAGIVRVYTEAPECPPLPWRVCMSGPVFRYLPPKRGRDREFTQVGIEMIGAGGPAADAEVIALADRSLRTVGIADAKIRVGHVGLIMEMLGRSGLPPAATEALVQMLSEAASDGGDVRALESAVDQLAGWLQSGREVDEVLPAVGQADDRGVDRLFRHLVPDVTGRRSGHEIINRLRRKWNLGTSLHEALDRVRAQVKALAGLRGPYREMLKRLAKEYAEIAPESVQALTDLANALEQRGIDLGRIELDLSFGRGIGFYTQMIFEMTVMTPDGPTDVCGGGRYDGLAKVLGSKRDDRGVGFAFGLERLYQILNDQDGKDRR
ncbi:MAG: histidine--tRNA ligase [Planctomycetes bacterium SCN 63-9]|nr:MAG: histidine--tRNA ligase [Planctomycetes bacterium SCN 63-9]